MCFCNTHLYVCNYMVHTYIVSIHTYIHLYVKGLSDPVGNILLLYMYSFTTEKECYKWVDQLWDVWFEEAYAECKAGV